MTYKAIAIALGAFIASAPVAAANSAGQQGSKAAAAAPAAAAEKKYCIQYENVVGSRVNRTECKTKAEWAKERIDVDRLLKE